MFALRDNKKLWYVNGHDNVELTKKNGGLWTVNVMKNRLGKVRLVDLGFTVYDTSKNLDKQNARRTLNNVGNVESKLRKLSRRVGRSLEYDTIFEGFS